MKKWICFVVTVALCACNSDHLSDDYKWRSDIFPNDLANTDKTIAEVMNMDDYWLAVKWVYYTEADAQGESMLYYDRDDKQTWFDGGSVPMFSVAGDVYTYYGSNTATPVGAFFRELQFNQISDDTFTIVYPDTGHTITIKVLDYDEDNLLIGKEASYKRDGVQYCYVVQHFVRQRATSLDWKDGYLPYDEYQKRVDEFWDQVHSNNNN